MYVVKKIGSAFTVNFKPASPIRVVGAGRLEEGGKEWAAVDAALKKADAAAAAKAATAAKGKDKAAGAGAGSQAAPAKEAPKAAAKAKAA